MKKNLNIFIMSTLLLENNLNCLASINDWDNIILDLDTNTLLKDDRYFQNVRGKYYLDIKKLHIIITTLFNHYYILIDYPIKDFNSKTINDMVSRYLNLLELANNGILKLYNNLNYYNQLDAHLLKELNLKNTIIINKHKSNFINDKTPKYYLGIVEYFKKSNTNFEIKETKKEFEFNMSKLFEFSASILKLNHNDTKDYTAIQIIPEENKEEITEDIKQENNEQNNKYIEEIDSESEEIIYEKKEIKQENKEDIKKENKVGTIDNKVINKPIKPNKPNKKIIDSIKHKINTNNRINNNEVNNNNRINNNEVNNNNVKNTNIENNETKLNNSKTIINIEPSNRSYVRTNSYYNTYRNNQDKYKYNSFDDNYNKYNNNDSFKVFQENCLFHAKIIYDNISNFFFSIKEKIKINYKYYFENNNKWNY